MAQMRKVTSDTGEVLGYSKRAGNSWEALIHVGVFGEEDGAAEHVRGVRQIMGQALVMAAVEAEMGETMGDVVEDSSGGLLGEVVHDSDGQMIGVVVANPSGGYVACAPVGVGDFGSARARLFAVRQEFLHQLPEG